MNSKYYETRYSFDKRRKIVWRAIAEYLQKFIPINSIIVELGAGYCDFINQIQGKKKYAIDIDPSLPQFSGNDVECLVADVSMALDLPDTSIDTFFASNLFEHFTDAQSINILKEIRRCLKADGRLIIIQPNYYYAYKEYWDDYTHIKVFSHISLSDFLTANGFKIVKRKKKFLPFSFHSIVPKSYYLTKLYLWSPVKPFGKQMLVVADCMNC